ncbi:hypothetical protein [Propionivibrio dicarboxylicus]|uniref:hypothetical protein n=1 Tax=Propionivibrio dicarboxylicus TaxID=83767 RepID=UPI000B823A7F|nr:hypothetical protein [Propionivibrio dicarboxylicus]
MGNKLIVVGRVVSLRDHLFRGITQQKSSRDAIENLFVVAAVKSKMRKLVCYGANLRIEVGLADVVFI